MFLSLLHVNVGDDPDRDQPGRRWLRDVYRVHQRLWMAFPDSKRREEDPFFLGAWNGAVLTEPKPTRSENGFLFRIERDGLPRILVQSVEQPYWDYAFQNAPYLLASDPDHRPKVRAFDPTPILDQTFRFRLQANPTKKVHALPEGSHRTTPLTKNGRRVPVPATEEALRGWLASRADRAGFRLIGDPSVQPGYVYVSKTREPGQGHRLRSVLYEGILEVTDADAFARTLAAGIGPAKGFGFGLLSVAPLRDCPAAP